MILLIGMCLMTFELIASLTYLNVRLCIVCVIVWMEILDLIFFVVSNQMV